MRKLLFFYATWCSPCRFYEEQFIKPLEELAGAEVIERVNAWQQSFRADEYHVNKLPTVVLLDGDTIYKSQTGAIDVERAAEWLKGGNR